MRDSTSVRCSPLPSVYHPSVGQSKEERMTVHSRGLMRFDRLLPRHALPLVLDKDLAHLQREQCEHTFPVDG